MRMKKMLHSGVNGYLKFYDKYHIWTVEAPRLSKITWISEHSTKTEIFIDFKKAISPSDNVWLSITGATENVKLAREQIQKKLDNFYWQLYFLIEEKTTMYSINCIHPFDFFIHVDVLLELCSYSDFLVFHRDIRIYRSPFDKYALNIATTELIYFMKTYFFRWINISFLQIWNSDFRRKNRITTNMVYWIQWLHPTGIYGEDNKRIYRISLYYPLRQIWSLKNTGVRKRRFISKLVIRFSS